MTSKNTLEKIFLTLLDHSDESLKSRIDLFAEANQFQVKHFSNRQDFAIFLKQKEYKDYQILLYTTPTYTDWIGERLVDRNTNLHVIIESESDSDISTTKLAHLESVLIIPKSKRGIVDFERIYQAFTYTKLLGLGHFVGNNERVFKRIVKCKQDKKEVLDEIHAFVLSKSTAKTLRVFEDYARAAVELLDELLLNSLFNANPAYVEAKRNTDFNLSPAEQITAKWSANAQIFAISVEDPFGALQKKDAFNYALDKVVTPFEQKTSGGRGLRMVYERLNSLILNVEPNHNTEVICLVELSNRITRYKTQIKTIHYKKNK